MTLEITPRRRRQKLTQGGFELAVVGARHARTVAALIRHGVSRSIAHGAGVYGYGYDERTEADLRRAYGPIVDDFRAIKARVDPEGRFGGGLPV